VDSIWIINVEVIAIVFASFFKYMLFINYHAVMEIIAQNRATLYSGNNLCNLVTHHDAPCDTLCHFYEFDTRESEHQTCTTKLPGVTLV